MSIIKNYPDGKWSLLHGSDKYEYKTLEETWAKYEELMEEKAKKTLGK